MSVRDLVEVDSPPTPGFSTLLTDQTKPVSQRVLQLAFAHTNMFYAMDRRMKSQFIRNDPTIAERRTFVLERLAETWDQAEAIVFSDPSNPQMRTRRFYQFRDMAFRNWVARPQKQLMH